MMKYTVKKEIRNSEFGREEVYGVYMQTKNEVTLDCYFNSEEKAQQYMHIMNRMNCINEMDTDDLRDAISKECEMNPRTEFFRDLEQELHDTECDLFKAYNNRSFIEQAQIKIRKMIKAVEEQKKS